MMRITRAELEELLQRWFKAEDLSAAEVDRLYQTWHECAKDELFVDMLWRQFDPANKVAFGTAWWEEHQQGEPIDKVLPITEADLVKMWLSYDPLARPPKRRPWCPDVLVGRWRLVGTRNDRSDEWSPPAALREWMLHPDGRMDVVGDPRYEGWTWAAHRSGPGLYLYLGPAGVPLPERRPVNLLESGEMEVVMSGRNPGYLLWRRPG